MAVTERSLSVINGNGSLQQFSPEKIDLIRNTVAKGTTNDELEMFLYLAGQYGLDPFKKEIWCIKYDKNAAATIMTSRDGYLKIAMSDSEYDGVKSFVVCEGDEFSIDAMTDQITHKFGTKRGKIVGAWAIAYHRSRRPQIAFVPFDEYNQGTSIWKKYPSAMIQKVAEAFVLKRQFSINGLVAQEEMQDGFSLDPQQPSRQETQNIKTQWLKAANDLNAFAESNNITKDELRSMGTRVVHKPDPKQWTLDDIAAVRAYVESEVVKYRQTDETPEVDAKQAVIDLGNGELLPDDKDLPF